MIRTASIAILIVGLVSGTASAQSLSAAAIAKSMTFAQSASSDWQQKYDAAKLKKDGGKKKIFIGLALIAGGTVIAATGGTSATCTETISTVSCDTNSRAKLGLLVDAAGSGTFIWGLVSYFDANSEMNRLSMQKPKAPAAVLTLSDHQAVALGVGRTSSVGYRLSW